MLRIGLPEELWMFVARDFTYHFYNHQDQFQNERDDGLPTPNAVARAPLASLAVKKQYSVDLVEIMRREGI
jgi:hypothetical protein